MKTLAFLLLMLYLNMYETTGDKAYLVKFMNKTLLKAGIKLNYLYL